MLIWLNREACRDSLSDVPEFNGGGIEDRKFLCAGASFEMTSEKFWLRTRQFLSLSCLFMSGGL